MVGCWTEQEKKLIFEFTVCHQSNCDLSLLTPWGCFSFGVFEDKVQLCIAETDIKIILLFPPLKGWAYMHVPIQMNLIDFFLLLLQQWYSLEWNGVISADRHMRDFLKVDFFSWLVLGGRHCWIVLAMVLDGGPCWIELVMVLGGR